MKKIFLFTIAIAYTLTATAQKGCNNSPAGWGKNLGRVTFKTNKTWKIGKQEWSDVVRAANCKKETYNGGISDSYNADCRQNPTGNVLFSWCAVTRFPNQICPRGWKMPTKEDFVQLEKTLNDIYKRMDGKKNDKPVKKYMIYGCSFQDLCCNGEGELISQQSYAQHWSQSEYDASYGYHLSFNVSDDIYPQSNSNKNYGFTVRCVKHHKKTFPLQDIVYVELPKDE
jgi:uncharacterized protein (TIGR02145 family)